MKTPKEIINGIMIDVMRIAVTAQDTNRFDKDERFIPCGVLNRAILDITDQIDREEREQEQKRRDEERWAKENMPVKKFLFIEDGSVDIEDLQERLKESNPEIKIVIYRQGSCRPIITDINDNTKEITGR